ncbi:MAG: HAMP domain-containing protein [Chloroflexi bacterium]|nr:HAMP domain-containing protein [Chloroflexota bacterium]
MKLSIGRKLVLAFGIVLVLMMVVGVLAVLQLNRARMTTEELIQIQEVIMAVDNAAGKIFEERVALDSYIFAGDEAGKTEFEQAKEAYEISWDVVKNHRGSEIPELIRAVEQARLVNHDLYSRTVVYHESTLGELINVVDKMTEADLYYEEHLKPAMQNLRDEEIARAREIAENARAISNTMLIAVAIVSALALGISIWAAYTISRGITQAAVHLSDATESISRGDLDVQIDVHTGDEMEVLAESIERMRVSLKAAIERLRVR